jgi:Leucine-rich repeat (LRR) protein
MKAIIKIHLSLLIIALLCQCNKDDEIENPIVSIPDQQFLNALIDAGVDTDRDGMISTNEAKETTSLELIDKNISDMSGIEMFVNLEVLFCVLNDLNSLDLSKNIALNHLECSYNNLTSLDLKNNTALTVLYCFGNQLSSLDISKNTELIHFGCDENSILN